MKLKPCPFCGKIPRLFPDDISVEFEGDGWAEIRCINDECFVKPAASDYSAWPDTRKNHIKAAVKKWNTRYETRN